MDSIEPTTMVGDILGRHPRAMRIFIDHGMACIGCAVAPYHTIEEACAEYGLSVETVVRELAEAANAPTRLRR